MVVALVKPLPFTVRLVTLAPATIFAGEIEVIVGATDWDGGGVGVVPVEPPPHPVMTRSTALNKIAAINFRVFIRAPSLSKPYQLDN